MHQLIHKGGVIFGAASLIVLAACQRNASTGDILSGYQPSAITDETLAELARLENNKFQVRVRNFDPNVELQKNPEWCWAACAVAVLKHSGVSPANVGRPLTQDDLIRAMAEHRRDQAASTDSVLLAMTPDLWQAYRQAEARAAQVKSNPPSGNGYWFEQNKPPVPGTATLVQEISAGGPAALALGRGKNDSTGNIVIAFEVTYSKAAIDFFAKQPYFVHQVKAIDPAIGEVITLDAADIEHTDFAAGRQAALQYIRASIDGMNKAQWKYTPPTTNTGSGKKVKLF